MNFYLAQDLHIIIYRKKLEWEPKEEQNETLL